MYKYQFLVNPSLTLESSISPLLSEASEMEDLLVKRMHQGVAHFVFKKKDGTLRTAYGTLKPELIPSVKEIASEELFTALNNVLDVSNSEEEARKLVATIRAKELPKPEKEVAVVTAQRYYDLEAKAFRAFSLDSLVFIF